MESRTRDVRTRTERWVHKTHRAAAAGPAGRRPATRGVLHRRGCGGQPAATATHRPGTPRRRLHDNTRFRCAVCDLNLDRLQWAWMEATEIRRPPLLCSICGGKTANSDVQGGTIYHSEWKELPSARICFVESKDVRVHVFHFHYSLWLYVCYSFAGWRTSSRGELSRGKPGNCGCCTGALDLRQM